MDTDPVTVIVTALTTGAAAGMKDTAGTVIKDAYAGLRRLITDRYHNVDIASVERAPGSPAATVSVTEVLATSNAAADADLLDAAQRVIAAVCTDAPETGAALGVDLEAIRAQAVRIRDVVAGGAGVRGRDWQVEGDITISGVRAGGAETLPHP